MAGAGCRLSLRPPRQTSWDMPTPARGYGSRRRVSGELSRTPLAGGEFRDVQRHEQGRRPPQARKAGTTIATMRNSP